jgi:hypothetical protein
MQEVLEVQEFFVVTSFHEDVAKIYKDWYEASGINGYRKKIAKNLQSYITIQTLARIYELIGLKWVNNNNRIGLDLRKFPKSEVVRFRNFIKERFKISGEIARATDGRYIIIFSFDQATKFLDLTQPYVRHVLNKESTILKMTGEPIEIIDQTSYDQEENE